MINAFQPRESKMKKVLMIAHSFPPFRSVGHSIRVIKFSKYLPALGWMPVILTIDDRKEYQDFLKQGSETLDSDIHQKVTIYRTAAGEPSLEFLEKERKFGQRNWLTAGIVKVLGGARRWTNRNILLPDRHLAWLPFAVRRGRQIVKSEGIDVIFATCPPHSDALIGAFLKLITGKPLILDFRDDWIDTPWYHSRSQIIRMIERRMESWAVKTADKVILVTEWSKNAFLERYPTQAREKFVFISNGVDLEEFAALNSMAESPLNSRFMILHAGSLNVSKSWGRGPAGLFQAVHDIQQQLPELTEKLSLVFAGDLPEEHQRLAEVMGLSGAIKVLGHVPHDEVLRLIQSADLLLAINYEGWSTLIPGKIYEYWAVGGPPILLLSCPGAAQNLVEKHKLGFVAPPNEIEAIAKAILMVYHARENGVPMQVHTDGIAEYDRKVLAKKLVQNLSGVCHD